jgi:hypothetical protein
MNWASIRPEKAAMALLYLEAVFYLKWGDYSELRRALMCLYIAHLLNLRAGGNEASEMYGEILAACDTPAHQSLVALAMRRDAEAVRRFQAFYIRYDWAQSVPQKVSAFLSEPRRQWEDGIAGLLAIREAGES